MGAIINERDRVCSHGIHHNLGGTEFIDMGSIIVEGVQIVWGSDRVDIID